VWVILELKLFLRKRNWNMRPFGSDIGPLDPNMMYPYLSFFFCHLLLGSKLDPLVIGEDKLSWTW
jgi:hypothetical protein